MYKQQRIGVVIPAYNVNGFLRRTVEGLPDLVDRVYVVDDGSSDNTANDIEGVFNKVCVLRHAINRGPGAAMATGCQAALKDEMDIIVKLDGDGQMLSDRIPSLISPIIEARADYTKGNRLSSSDHRKSMPRFRLFGNFLLTGLTRIASGYWHVNDTQNGFVAISRRALDQINIETIYPRYGYLNDILVRLNVSGFKIQDEPMPAVYGDEKSSIRLKSFVPRVGLFLLTRFLWRLKVRYLSSKRSIGKKGKRLGMIGT